MNKDQNFRHSSHRRFFLKRAAASAAGLGIAGITETMAVAAKMKMPPLPENVMTADAALERLMEGNERYVAGLSKPLNFAADRAALVTGQNPYATILRCPDCRSQRACDRLYMTRKLLVIINRANGGANRATALMTQNHDQGGMQYDRGVLKRSDKVGGEIITRDTSHE